MPEIPIPAEVSELVASIQRGEYAVVEHCDPDVYDAEAWDQPGRIECPCGGGCWDNVRVMPRIETETAFAERGLL